MESVIKMLEIKREQLIQELKVAEGEAHTQILEGKRELDTAIQWLKKIKILELNNVNDYIFTKLPETKMAFSEYKIVETLEYDDPKDWQEVKLTNEDEEVWLYEGDWVIKSKK